jgi:hypothetical protein
MQWNGSGTQRNSTPRSLAGTTKNPPQPQPPPPPQQQQQAWPEAPKPTITTSTSLARSTKKLQQQ